MNRLTRAATASIAVCQLATDAGAHLFAPSCSAGKLIDAERAFYDTPTPDVHGEAGSMIRSEPANDDALPPATSVTTARSQALSIDEKAFRCITKMTQVGYFYVDNLTGDLSATVRVAESRSGGVYPVGSVLQLVPTEVMVKREPGFNAATHDWEFFSLEVTPEASIILARGAAEVNNRFGGNCFRCHVKAHPEWDLVCSNNHGCDPIPITRAMSRALQRTDPRCKTRGPIRAEDAAALEQLNDILKAHAAAGT